MRRVLGIQCLNFTVAVRFRLFSKDLALNPRVQFGLSRLLLSVFPFFALCTVARYACQQNISPELAACYDD